MRTQGTGGSIINTASVAGISAWAYAAPYGATKAAVIQLTKVAALEYARDKIRVNCVCPGTFLSNMHKNLSADAIEAIRTKHPLGLGEPEDLVDAYMYLAGDGSQWTTGATLVVDGGYSIP
jgi:3-oxoacyl-[acyl-carrier protein] reductase